MQGENNPSNNNNHQDQNNENNNQDDQNNGINQQNDGSEGGIPQEQRRQLLLRNLFELMHQTVLVQRDEDDQQHLNHNARDEDPQDLSQEHEDQDDSNDDSNDDDDNEGRDLGLPFFRLDEIDDDEEEEGDAQDQQPQQNINFDRTLPTRHNYLGEIEYVDENLKAKLLDGGHILKDLPILALKNVVLLPGEVIPLKIFDRNERMMFIDIIGQIPFKHFGILHVNDINNYCKIGTTVQINSIKVTGSMISILAVGIQRFDVLSLTTNERSNMVYVDAKIIEDRENNNHHLYKNISLVSPVKCSKSSFFRNILQHNASHFGPKLFQEFDCSALMKKAKELIINNLHFAGPNSSNNQLLEEKDSQYCFNSTNPTQFSFWAIKMLPVDNSSKQVFLEIHSTYYRLVEIIRILEKYNNIYCKSCFSLVSNKENIFSMCEDGPSSSFVNPHGYVHQLCTLKRVTGVYLVGFPSSRDSWFPAYKWTILNCVRCHSHLGWKFTTDIRNMEPKFFYGLSRANISSEPSHLDTYDSHPHNRSNRTKNEDEEEDDMSDEN